MSSCQLPRKSVSQFLHSFLRESQGRWILLISLAIIAFGSLKHLAATAQNQPPITLVSSANGEINALAPESFATAYGVRLATQSEVAAVPQSQLAGTTVSVRDSAGVSRAALLLFVSP